VTCRQLTDEQWKLIEQFLPIGEYGPRPERLRDQFEGGDLMVQDRRAVAGGAGSIRALADRLRTLPGLAERRCLHRPAGGLIAEAARQGKTDLSLISVDSTTVRAHHDAAGMIVGKAVMEALEEAAAEQDQTRQEGVTRRNRTGGTAETSLSRPTADASAADGDSF